ncbi:hypothetical protein Dimus_029685 [Dionaea muscipula]
MDAGDRLLHLLVPGELQPNQQPRLLRQSAIQPPRDRPNLTGHRRPHLPPDPRLLQAPQRHGDDPPDDHQAEEPLFPRHLLHGHRRPLPRFPLPNYQPDGPRPQWEQVHRSIAHFPSPAPQPRVPRSGPEQVHRNHTGGVRVLQEPDHLHHVGQEPADRDDPEVVQARELLNL